MPLVGTMVGIALLLALVLSAVLGKMLGEGGAAQVIVRRPAEPGAALLLQLTF